MNRYIIWIIYLVLVILVIYYYDENRKYKEEQRENEKIRNAMKNYNTTTYSDKKYSIKTNPMTINERKFYYILKEITDKKNLIIIPQINLQTIFVPNDKKNYTDFNKIKAKSIDFAIVDENYYYKAFIEIDDSSHNNIDRKKRDEFINQLFKEYNLKLIRINSNTDYNKILLENKLKEVV